MDILLMILGVLGLINADKIVEVLSSSVVILFAVYLHGSFDQLLGVCG